MARGARAFRTDWADPAPRSHRHNCLLQPARREKAAVGRRTTEVWLSGCTDRARLPSATRVARRSRSAITDARRRAAHQPPPRQCRATCPMRRAKHSADSTALRCAAQARAARHRKVASVWRPVSQGLSPRGAREPVADAPLSPGPVELVSWARAHLREGSSAQRKGWARAARLPQRAPPRRGPCRSAHRRALAGVSGIVQQASPVAAATAAQVLPSSEFSVVPNRRATPVN
jgi:hypothetical protein